MKRILPAYADDETFIVRFRREAEISSRLVHPNVVQVLDFGHFGTTYFLAMEFVEGVPLSRLRSASMPFSVVSYLALELSAALDFIHQRTGQEGQPLGLVHRDINPPNVLLSVHGEVKLADFGVVRATGSGPATATGAVPGKLQYFAPEQALGQPYDGRADLYSLGLTLYELLVGHRARPNADGLALVHALVNDELPALSAERPDIPPALEALVHGLLRRDPAERTATAGLRRAQVAALEGAAAPLPLGRATLARLVKAGMQGPLSSPPGNPALPEGHTETATLAT